jgi:hypothetical protein
VGQEFDVELGEVDEPPHACTPPNAIVVATTTATKSFRMAVLLRRAGGAPFVIGQTI